MSKKIIIDGNIGSGKSTVMERLEKVFKNEYRDVFNKNLYNKKCILDNINIIQEPVEEWKPYLDNFYSDMKVNSLALQMKILKHHISIPKNNFKHKYEIVISERSSISAIDVFGKNLLNNNLLNKLDIDLMYDYNKQFNIFPDLFIYIDTSAEICHERINNRNRGIENKISLEYLKDIENLYKIMYENPKIKEKAIIIDGNEDMDSVYNKMVVTLKQEIGNFYNDVYSYL